MSRRDPATAACHLGSKLVCMDGPVFSRAQLKKLQADIL